MRRQRQVVSRRHSGNRALGQLSFALGSTSKAAVDAWKTALWPVLDEDIFATEEIEYIVQTSATLPPELMLKSDATAVEGRRMLQRMMDAERGREATSAD